MHLHERRPSSGRRFSQAEPGTRSKGETRARSAREGPPFTAPNATTFCIMCRTRPAVPIGVPNFDTKNCYAPGSGLSFTYVSGSEGGPSLALRAQLGSPPLLTRAQDSDHASTGSATLISQFSILNSQLPLLPGFRLLTSHFSLLTSPSMMLSCVFS